MAFRRNSEERTEESLLLSIPERSDDGIEEEDAKSPGLPSSIKYIVGNELCERLSFYGMRAILALFLVDHLRLTQQDATEVVHLFIMAAYASPLLGAFVSDSYLGKYQTILYFSLAYCTGNWVLAWSAVQGGSARGQPGDPVAPPIVTARFIALAGLSLVAVGTGGIKPCVCSFGGDQIDLTTPPGPHRQRLLELFFPIFYFSINLGSCIAMIVTPLVRHYVDYQAAFLIPAVLMMVALLLFWLGRYDYHHVRPSGNVATAVAHVIVTAVRRNRGNNASVSRESLVNGEPAVFANCNCLPARPSSIPAPIPDRPHWLDSAKLEFGEQRVEDVKALLRVLVLFLPAPIFWSLFDQQASRWTFQAERMDGRVPGIPWLYIMPDQMQVLNAIFILTFIPLFNKIIYPALSALGVSLAPIRRMVIGIVLCGCAFLISSALEVVIEARANLHELPPVHATAAGAGTVFGSPSSLLISKKVPILWQVPQYMCITAAEIMFSITGLELAYTQAPASMTAVVQSCWLLTDAAGNLVTVLVVSNLSPLMSRPVEFVFFALMCFASAVLMALLGRNFRYLGTVEKNIDGESTREEEEVALVGNGEANGALDR